MRLRTLPNAIEELKKDDPKCDLTKTALRRLVKEEKIPYRKAGNKYLVDVDDLISVLFNRNAEVIKDAKI